MTFQKTDSDNDHKISRAEFVQHMKLTKCIKQCQWDALFDELDADNSGALSHQEFWAKMAIKNSPGLMDALDQFDVSMVNAQSRLVQMFKKIKFNSPFLFPMTTKVPPFLIQLQLEFSPNIKHSRPSRYYLPKWPLKLLELLH